MKTTTMTLIAGLFAIVSSTSAQQPSRTLEAEARQAEAPQARQSTTLIDAKFFIFMAGEVKKLGKDDVEKAYLAAQAIAEGTSKAISKPHHDILLAEETRLRTAGQITEANVIKGVLALIERVGIPVQADYQTTSFFSTRTAPIAEGFNARGKTADVFSEEKALEHFVETFEKASMSAATNSDPAGEKVYGDFAKAAVIALKLYKHQSVSAADKEFAGPRLENRRDKAEGDSRPMFAKLLGRIITENSLPLVASGSPSTPPVQMAANVPPQPPQVLPPPVRQATAPEPEAKPQPSAPSKSRIVKTGEKIEIPPPQPTNTR